jgi:hypothetical protein
MDQDSDPEPPIFAIDLQEANEEHTGIKKIICNKTVGFSYFFCLMIEGFGSGAGS